MPQKKNSDVAELIRGRSAGGIAGVIEILTVDERSTAHI